MCNPLWLISHQHWLNHTSAYKSSDWLQKQESIKKHCLSQTCGSWYICFLFIHPCWKLNVHCTLPIKIHHPAACDPGHGAVPERGCFPPASCPALSDHPRHPQQGLSMGVPLIQRKGSVLERSCFTFWGCRLHGALKGYVWRWRSVADSALDKGSKYIGLFLLTLNSKISWSVSKY